jgi:excisionase family DNA binding protein
VQNPNITLLTPAPAGQSRPRIAEQFIEPLQVTVREAARLLSHSERTIHRLIQSGELSSIGQGRMRRIPMASIRAYQERHLSILE